MYSKHSKVYDKRVHEWNYVLDATSHTFDNPTSSQWWQYTALAMEQPLWFGFGSHYHIVEKAHLWVSFTIYYLNTPYNGLIALTIMLACYQNCWLVTKLFTWLFLSSNLGIYALLPLGMDEHLTRASFLLSKDMECNLVCCKPCDC